jgi:glycosyltransferase involved in cell wall biosynthesis
MKIIILGYRVSGLDGVSLETVHWKNILTRMGHKVTLVAGELDQEGILIPELHFKWPKVAGIHDRVVYGDESYEKVEKAIFEVAGGIEGKLRKLFRNGVGCDLLIVPNVFSIPMHFPLAVALTRTIGEFSIKTLARHHDFWWERGRYNKSHMFHFFEHWFPPKLDLMYHTVINSLAQKSLKKKTGIDAPIISDTFDFENHKLNKIDSYSKYFRRDFKIDKDDIVFLQATRIVPRKRIELSIKLLADLDLPNAILVVSGHEGDEKKGYYSSIKKMAKELGIRYRFIGARINSHRKIINGSRIYTLWDCYVNSDFTTYPTEKEGFGNQFIESMYFKKPIILTPYPVYKKDIEPHGFDVIEMSEKDNSRAIKKIKRLIKNKSVRKEAVDHNFNLAKEHYDYEVIGKKIKRLFKDMELK